MYDLSIHHFKHLVAFAEIHSGSHDNCRLITRNPSGPVSNLSKPRGKVSYCHDNNLRKSIQCCLNVSWRIANVYRLSVTLIRCIQLSLFYNLIKNCWLILHSISGRLFSYIMCYIHVCVCMYLCLCACLRICVCKWIHKLLYIKYYLTLNLMICVPQLLSQICNKYRSYWGVAVPLVDLVR